MMNYINQPENLAGNSTAKVKWEQQQQGQNYYNEADFGLFPTQNFQSLIAGDSPPVKPDPDLENVWTELGNFQIPNSGFGNCGYENGSGYELNYPISRTSSCRPAVAVAPAVKIRGSSVLSQKLSYSVGRQTFKKRKAEKFQKIKGLAEDEIKVKKLKGYSEEEEESKITNQNNRNRKNSANNSKENSKVSEVQKPDYIHVRARRGQATDSHSLAERVRREKISERMKYLQDLVPGCNKITGKAGMLDEIINYVQSLQQQVEFLSMKLAVVNPSLEVFPANFPAIGVSPEMSNPGYIQLDSMEQVFPIHEEYIDSSNLNLISSMWDSDMEFHSERSSAFLSQNFTGSIEGSNLKREK